MKHLLITIAVMFATFAVKAQYDGDVNKVLAKLALGQADEKIIWSQDRPLTWSDFKGRVDNSSDLAAMTNVTTTFNFISRRQDDKYVLKFTVTSYFLPLKSWAKTESETDKLLHHEQVHFDINEYFARTLLASLNSFVYTSAYQSEVGQITHENYNLREEMQALYDKKTNHSKDEKMQAKWEAFVAELLKENYSLEQARQKMSLL